MKISFEIYSKDIGSLTPRNILGYDIRSALNFDWQIPQVSTRFKLKKDDDFNIMIESSNTSMDQGEKFDWSRVVYRFIH